jgi:hypothetical protein
MRTITVLAAASTLVLGLAAVATPQGFAQSRLNHQSGATTMGRDHDGSRDRDGLHDRDSLRDRDRDRARDRDRDDRFQAHQSERSFNSNGTRGVDRDRGRDRAEDRRELRRDHDRDDVMRR